MMFIQSISGGDGRLAAHVSQLGTCQVRWRRSLGLTWLRAGPSSEPAKLGGEMET